MPLTRRLRAEGEEGLALVVALVIVLLVFLLISTALAQALFDLSQSTLVRRRYEAMNAAEAGVSWYSQILSTASVSTITMAPWVKDGRGRYVATEPEGMGLAVGGGDDPARFTVEVTYLKTDPCPTSASSKKVLCSVASATPFTAWDETLPDPIYAMVTSVGRAGGVTRAVEVPIRLHPQRTTAISDGFAFGAFCIGASAQVKVTGGQISASGGSWPAGYTGCPSSGVSVPASATFTTSGGALLTSGGFTAAGNPGSVTTSGRVHAAGVVTVGSGSLTAESNWGKCTGTKYVKLNGGAYGSDIKVYGTACAPGSATGQGAPTIASLKYTTAFDAGEWTSAGFKVGAGTPPADLATSSRTVYNLATCIGPLVLANATYTVKWDLAIVSPCGFEISNAAFLGSGSIFLIVARSDACPGGVGKTMLAGVSAPQPFFISTPCVLDIRSTTLSKAGITAGAFYAGGVVDLTFVASATLGIPGPVSSFTQDVRYFRELSAQEIEDLS